MDIWDRNLYNDDSQQILIFFKYEINKDYTYKKNYLESEGVK